MGKEWGLVALCAFWPACATSHQTPVTQIVVAITSDLTPKTELARIEVKVSKRDGSDVVAMQDYAIVGKSPKRGQQKLPVTFSITKGQDEFFLLVVTGFGPLGPNGAETKLVEQRVIATFQDGKTLLLQIFLGRVCLEQFCDDAGTQVCYSADAGKVKAGDCGQLPMLDSRDLKTLDVRNLPDLALLPKGVKRVDAGAGDAAMDAKVTDAGTDASADGAAPNTGGTGGDGAGGVGETSGSGVGGQGGTGGNMSSEPCASANGGCDPLVTCSARGSGVKCGTCPSGYDDTNGNGTRCTDIDECALGFATCDTNATCSNTAGSFSCACRPGYRGNGVSCVDIDECTQGTSNCDANAACTNTAGSFSCACNVGYTGDGLSCADDDKCATNNGGCGSSTDYTCTNNIGAAPTCTAIGDCSGANVCTADYPCEILGLSYTCRGQFADWSPNDVPATFTDNGDGTVTDTRSGLVWQQTVNTSGYAWLDAKTYCVGLSLAGTGWRLPTKAELESLVDVSRYNPAMDPIAFPSAPAEATWSSSPTLNTPGYAWIVVFNVGSSSVSGSLEGSPCPVRAEQRSSVYIDWQWGRTAGSLHGQPQRDRVRYAHEAHLAAGRGREHVHTGQCEQLLCGCHTG